MVQVKLGGIEAMELVSIKNKYTNHEVCGHYLNKEINKPKCRAIVGEHLLVVYSDGSYFTHEEVVHISRMTDGTTTVETTRKIWIFQW